MECVGIDQAWNFDFIGVRRMYNPNFHAGVWGIGLQLDHPVFGLKESGAAAG